MAADEFALIERFFTRPVDDPDVRLGIGDDAAVLQHDGLIAVAVDTLVADVHFPQGMSATAIGHRALAVNLSDLAAMGAAPRWCTLALTLPEADEGWLKAFAAGLFELADRFQVSLVGGDLTRGPLTISVQVIGAVADSGPLTRSGAQAGDQLFVTGSLGDSAAGLARLRDARHISSTDPDALIQRFLWPQPRVTAGLALNGVAASCIDISDGLLADCGHICTASGCRGVIELERLPLSDGLLANMSQEKARQLALSGGDDYELLFSMAEGTSEAQLSKRLGLPVTRVGFMKPGSGTALTLQGKPVAMPGRGYSHF
jgi:thiamine-monophosphate kinase